MIGQECETYTKHPNSVFYINGLVKLTGLVFLTLVRQTLFTLKVLSLPQGLYIIFQIDWKRCIIELAKYLPSSLRLEVSGYTVSIAPYGCLPHSLSFWRFVGNTVIMFNTPNMAYPIKQRLKLLVVFE